MRFFLLPRIINCFVRALCIEHEANCEVSDCYFQLKLLTSDDDIWISIYKFLKLLKESDARCDQSAVVTTFPTTRIHGDSDSPDVFSTMSFRVPNHERSLLCMPF